MKILSLVAALMAMALNAGAELPALVGVDLEGKPFALAERLNGRFGILVFGFSRASEKQTKLWGEALRADFLSDTRVAIVNVALLQEAPGFIRPMIKRGIKKGMPKERWPWTVTLDKDTDVWRKALKFEAAAKDQGYFLVVGPAGDEELCLSHESFGPDAYKALGDCLRSQLVKGAKRP